MSELLNHNLSALLRPRAIALLGVSDDPAKMAGNALPVIAASGYMGTVYLVNSKRATVGGLKAYPSVLEIPGDVDLALITLPRAAVIDAIDQCGRKGIGAAVIITAGFAESGEEGARLQTELAEKARYYGIRIIGPNCTGMYSAEVDLPLGTSAAFATGRYRKGSIGLITQSGALGTALLPRAKERNVGVSVWFSTGNEMDLGVADLLAAAVSAPGTRAICLYLEAIRDVGKMSVGATTALNAGVPIVALKVGTSRIGAERARAHSGALIGSDAVYDGYFRQLAILRVRNVDHLLPVASAFDTNRVFAGGRMAVFSISGALAGHIADRFEDEGVVLAKLHPDTIDKLCKYSENDSAGNPYDPGALPIRSPELAFSAMQALVQDPNVDGLVIMMSFALHMYRVLPPIIQRVAEQTTKMISVIRWIPADYQTDAFSSLVSLGVPIFYSVDECAVALGARSTYERARPKVLDAAKQRATLNPHQTAPELAAGSVLLETECRAILRRYGIRSPREEVANNAESAEQAATLIGFPVVLKILSRDILHKTEAGAVVLDIRDASAARDAFEQILTSIAELRPEADHEGMLVQAMAPSGIDAILGAKQEAPFGPVVIIGLGGTLVEALARVAARPAPLVRLDAEEMIDECGLGALLASARAGRAYDREAVVDAIISVSRLMVDHGDRIAELDINPLRVFTQGQGALALDALIVPWQ